MRDDRERLLDIEEAIAIEKVLGEVDSKLVK
jgi:hypothetical protein